MILAMAIIMNDGDDDNGVTMMTMMVTQGCRCRPAAHQGRHYSPSSHLPSSSSSELVIAIFMAVTIIVVNNPKTDILTKCVEHIDTIKSGFAKKLMAGRKSHYYSPTLQKVTT